MKKILLILFGIVIFWYTNDGAIKQVFTVDEPYEPRIYRRGQGGYYRYDNGSLLFMYNGKIYTIIGGMIRIEGGIR